MPDKFKVAVAGCGSRSKVWIDYAKQRPDTEIVALVDINKNNAMAAAEKHGLHCSVFTDLAEAIRTAGANLVFDITIPESHKSVVTTSVSHGCDVFGEKPIAPSMEDALEMVRFVEKSEKMYAIMQNRRYTKPIRAFKDVIQAETIGKPGFICVDFFMGPHFGGFRDAMDSPLILDMAIHTFDQARFIAGQEPVSVYCHEFNPSGSWYDGNASAVCVFELSDGSTFCYRGSWCAEGAPTSSYGVWRITGSKGTAIWDGENTPYCEVIEPHQEGAFRKVVRRTEPELTYEGKDIHEGCLDEMFQALLEGRRAETDCRDNLRSMYMVFGALKSARTGKKVMLDVYHYPL